MKSACPSIGPGCTAPHARAGTESSSQRGAGEGTTGTGLAVAGDLPTECEAPVLPQLEDSEFRVGGRPAAGPQQALCRTNSFLRPSPVPQATRLEQDANFEVL